MIFKIYADLLISGDKFWVDIPIKNDTKNKVDAVLKQYVVEEGKVISIEKLDVEEGAEVTFDEVLLVLNAHQ